MAKRKDKPKGKRTTARKVQAEEAKPLTLPTVPVKPETDEDAWGPDGLTLKQRRFCEAYVGEAAGNATLAAKLAGYNAENMVTLASTAYENLRKPQIRGYIGRLLASLGMTPEFLQSRLAELARCSMDNFLTMTPEGDIVVDLKQAAELGAMGQLKEIREETVELGTNLVKRKRWIKVHDPMRAIATLAEMQGMVIHRHEVTGAKGGPIEHAHVVRDIIADPESTRLANALARRMAGHARRHGESAN